MSQSPQSDTHLADQQGGAENPTAAILIIGDEILCGQTQDINIHFLSNALLKIGIRVNEARIIPDDQEIIVRSVLALSKNHDYVFSTGGLGPTHDDITADAMAKAFNVSIDENPEAKKILVNHYGDHITPARLRMARIPEGATLIKNPVSAAPGFKIQNVYVLAGVPKIAQAMFASIECHLKRGAPLYAVSVRSDLPESLLADSVRMLQEQFQSVTIGSYPYFKMNIHGVALVARSHDYAKLVCVKESLESLIIQNQGTPTIEWLMHP